MKVHPDARVLPSMAEDEYVGLADDIAAHGLLEDITLLDGAILDGRHRQQACDERGVEPRYVEWDPTCGITPLEWVIAKNLHRRQLTVSQRAALAAELKDRLAEAARERMAEGGRKGSPGKGVPKRAHLSTTDDMHTRSRERAAKAFGVGHMTVDRVLKVRDADPEMFQRVKRGEITATAARRELGLVGQPGPKNRRGANKQRLEAALDPLDKYLKHWSEYALRGIAPGEARALLRKVQRIDGQLIELERALMARTVVSRALK